MERRGEALQFIRALSSRIPHIYVKPLVASAEKYAASRGSGAEPSGSNWLNVRGHGATLVYYTDWGCGQRRQIDTVAQIDASRRMFGVLDSMS